MEESTKVTIVIIVAVVMAFLGYAIKGLFGASMGFVLTLVIVGFFSLWKKYAT